VLNLIYESKPGEVYMIRKVVGVERFHVTYDQQYDLTLEYWVSIADETSTTYAIDSFHATIYYKGAYLSSASYCSRKPTKLNKDLVRAFIDTEDLPKKAMAYANTRLVTRGQKWTLKVLSWDTNRGQGYGIVEELGYFTDIHGCNATNALTCYDETACINLTKGDLIEIELADMGSHLTPTKFMGQFDEAKSKGLDHSKLAFLRRDDKIVSGMLPEGESLF
jgi:hypothetical protein